MNKCMDKAGMIAQEFAIPDRYIKAYYENLLAVLREDDRALELEIAGKRDDENKDIEDLVGVTDEA
jgi:hypothetical protein